MEIYTSLCQEGEIKEREEGLSKLINKDLECWTYEISSKLPLCNITVLFRGDPEEGILSAVSHGTLELGEKLIDQLTECNEEDPRVMEFNYFKSLSPFPAFLKGKLTIRIYFHSYHKNEPDQVRILADEVHFSGLIPEQLSKGKWIFPLPSCTLCCGNGEVKAEASRWKTILKEEIAEQKKLNQPFLNEKSDDVHLGHFGIKSEELESKLDLLVAWTVQRQLIREKMKEIA